MKESDFQRLKKIKQYCEEIDGFIEGLTLAEFSADLKTKRAVTMNLTQIGELVYRISDEVKLIYNAPRKQIAGLRHRLVHDYINIDYYAIWDICENHISPFYKTVLTIICDK